jgi:hypothetical protein
VTASHRKGAAVKRLAAVLFAATAILSFPLHAQDRRADAANPNDPAVKAATEQAGQSARRWLAQFDANNFDACWDALAPAVKDRAGKDEFDASLAAVRQHYGAARQRRASKVTFTHKLPDAPDGDYVVLQYNTAFANGHALETLFQMRTPDGWKVSGYVVH